jgi:hypothetical protein
MSPDRALKETVEWKPTVTRKPRMDAQLRLDIERLKSQKEEMKRNAEGEAHIVYGYLRAKDSGTGKAGSPYYVGIGNSHTRAFERHKRGANSNRYRDVPVPKNEALVRQFGVFKTRAEAAAREQALIAHFGRKGIDPGGTLLNRTLGGDGSLGLKPNTETRAKISAASRGRVHSAETRAKIGAANKAAPENYVQRGVSRRLGSAAKYGIDPDKFLALSAKQRGLVMTRYASGKRGDELLRHIDDNSGVNPQLIASAEKYGATLDQWLSFSTKQRVMVATRYSRGKRGADLLKGLI